MFCMGLSVANPPLRRRLTGREAAMLHEPAAPTADDSAASYKSRLGVWMFLFYSILYAGFVAVNLIWPLLMEKVVFMGLNVAVVYGFGLIVVALIQALIYDLMCRRREKSLSREEEF